jgi:hypothetical protein
MREFPQVAHVWSKWDFKSATIRWKLLLEPGFIYWIRAAQLLEIYQFQMDHSKWWRRWVYVESNRSEEASWFLETVQKLFPRLAKTFSYFQLNTVLPVHRPRFDMTNHDASFSHLSYTWLGHSTTVVQMDGANIVTDPVWAYPSGPTRFRGSKRYRPPPCTIAELPLVGNNLSTWLDTKHGHLGRTSFFVLLIHRWTLYSSRTIIMIISIILQ